MTSSQNYYAALDQSALSAATRPRILPVKGDDKNMVASLQAQDDDAEALVNSQGLMASGPDSSNSDIVEADTDLATNAPNFTPYSSLVELANSTVSSALSSTPATSWENISDTEKVTSHLVLGSNKDEEGIATAGDEQQVVEADAQTQSQVEIKTDTTIEGIRKRKNQARKIRRKATKTALAAVSVSTGNDVHVVGSEDMTQPTPSQDAVDATENSSNLTELPNGTTTLVSELTSELGTVVDGGLGGFDVATVESQVQVALSTPIEDQATEASGSESSEVLQQSADSIVDIPTEVLDDEYAFTVLEQFGDAMAVHVRSKSGKKFDLHSEEVAEALLRVFALHSVGAVLMKMATKAPKDKAVNVPSIGPCVQMVGNSAFLTDDKMPGDDAEPEAVEDLADATKDEVHSEVEVVLPPLKKKKSSKRGKKGGKRVKKIPATAVKTGYSKLEHTHLVSLLGLFIMFATWLCRA